MELLAPAGNKAALIQAIANGADAVYLGYTAFSARQGAGNFDRDELTEAIALCHLHQVRVYVTVNTLVKQSEMSALHETLDMIAGACADAVILQDIGVARVVTERYPTLPIHASTQMSLHNVQGVRFAKKMGFTRVVAARECTLDEIALMCQEGIEIEMFVHGAMCISQSGQCLFSSMIGSRSGNRGRCAQPCRLDYRFEKAQGAYLSPRDIMLREQVDLLEKAGVTSLKIEGRLKRPEYVATVTASYRRALDKQTQSSGQERETLMQVFNRGGFMRGHAMGEEDADIIYPDRVNHLGIEIGTVISFHKGMARIALTRDLHDGDGLQFRASRDTEVVYSGKDTRAGETALCFLRDHADVPIGATVARLTDSKQMADAIKSIPPLKVDMSLYVMPNEPMQLTVCDTTVIGDVAQQAQKAPLTAQAALQTLQKTGGTGFVLGNATVQTKDAFAPVSQLNALRRQGLEAFSKAQAESFYRSGQLGKSCVNNPKQAIKVFNYQKVIRASNPSVFEETALNLYQPLQYNDEAFTRLTMPVWLCLPAMCQSDTLKDIIALAEKHKLQGLVLGTMGQLGIQTALPVAASEGLPAWNRQAAQTLVDWGCHFIIVSPELSKTEVEALKGFPIVVPSYGRVRLMVLSHCPRRTVKGHKKARKECRLCENTPLSPLVDRKGAAYPLLKVRLPEGCRIYVMDSKHIDITGKHSFPALYDYLVDCGQEGSHGHFYKPVE